MKSTRVSNAFFVIVYIKSLKENLQPIKHHVTKCVDIQHQTCTHDDITHFTAVAIVSSEASVVEGYPTVAKTRMAGGRHDG